MNTEKLSRYSWFFPSSSSPFMVAKEELISERRWIKILKEWNLSEKFSIDKGILDNIPDSARSNAWSAIILSCIPEDEIPRCLVNNIPENMKFRQNQIDGDVSRVFPDTPFFLLRTTQESLRRILCSYAVLDPELNYVQGMAFTASMLLCYMDEETAFKCFYSIFRSRKYNMREIYLNGFSKVRDLNVLWNSIVENRYPRIFKRFKELNLFPELYTLSWFLTFFMDQGFPPEIRLLIFDRFIGFGLRAVYSFALVILEVHKVIFLRRGAATITSILQTPDKSSLMRKSQRIVKLYNKLFISRKDFLSFLIKANVDIPFL